MNPNIPELDNLLYKYNKPILWNVGVLSQHNHMEYAKFLIDFFEFIDMPSPISFIHGSYLSKYNGGRQSIGDNYSEQEIKDQIKYFNDHNIGIKLTFSRHDMSERDYTEKEMRFYLDLISENKNVRNGIILQDDHFAEFLKKEYPWLELTASYCKHEFETIPGETDTIDYYNNLFNLYDIVVFNTIKAYDDEFLSQIKFPERAEFIVNHACWPNCKLAKSHHTKSAEASYCTYCMIKKQRESQMRAKSVEVREEMDKILQNCTNLKVRYNLENWKLYNKFFITKKLINHLNDFGINIFKIEGRDASVLQLGYYTTKYFFDENSNFEKLIAYFRTYMDDVNNNKYGMRFGEAYKFGEITDVWHPLQFMYS